MSRCTDCDLPTISQTNGEDERNARCRPCIELADGEPSVRVSQLESSDLALVLAWRSHPQIYDHFRQQNGPLDWNGHVAWFNERDSDRYDFVLRFDGRRVGVVNIDSNDEVGIFLGDFSAHGQGVATVALNWLCRRFENRAPLTAEIHVQNEDSKQLFSRCGFQPDWSDGDWIQYVYNP